MPGWPVLGLFLLAALPIAFAPGPSVAFIVATTLRGGRRAGVGAVAGVEIGYLVHVLAAVVGVSAVLAASAEAFTIVKLAGVGYLVWLGIRAWRSRDERTLDELRSSGPLLGPASALRQGLVVGALNPKTAIFFMSFLPQFVDPTRGPVWPQLSVLGVLFILVATVPDLSWALAGGALSTRLRTVKAKTLERVSGTVCLGLAAVSLTARRAA